MCDAGTCPQVESVDLGRYLSCGDCELLRRQRRRRWQWQWQWALRAMRAMRAMEETAAARSHAERLLLFERENMATL